jgi:uncharacterized protein YciI
MTPASIVRRAALAGAMVLTAAAPAARRARKARALSAVAGRGGVLVEPIDLEVDAEGWALSLWRWNSPDSAGVKLAREGGMNVKTVLVAALVLGLVGWGAAASSAGEGAEAPPRHFLVLLGLGSGYDKSLPVRQQKAFPAHAAYMSDLESQGKLVFGGPLLDSFESLQATGGVLVVRADTADEARRLAAGDPSHLLAVQEVRPMLLAVTAPKK